MITDRFNKNILNDILILLNSLKNYIVTQRTLDELSAHLTSLLFVYSQFAIRQLIDQIMLQCAEMANKTDKDVIFSVCKAINIAFSFIEQALEHFSISLLNFTLDKSIEDFENNKDKFHVFDEMLRLTKNVKEILPSEKYYWENFIIATIEIEQATSEGVQAASRRDRTYSLHAVAKTGDVAALQRLLNIDRIKINECDQNGHPAIFYTVSNNHFESFELLVAHGADWINSIDITKGNNLLQVAAYYGSFAFIPILLINGISADTLNDKNQSALMLSAKFIAFNKKYHLRRQKYSPSITALAYLLCYTKEQRYNSENDAGVRFYHALIRFRKHVSLLFILHNSGTLLLPIDIINNIALQIEDSVPNKIYKHCYRDIIQSLLLNKDLLSKFLMLGMQSAYYDCITTKQINIDLIANVKTKIFCLLPDALISHEFINPSPLNDDEKLALSNYYLSNVSDGAASLAAITLAQRQIRTHPSTKIPLSQEDKYNDRRLVIQEWKIKYQRKKMKAWQRLFY